MKKWLAFLLAALALCGCGQELSWETVNDTALTAAPGPVRPVLLDLPSDAAALTAAADGENQLYICRDYTLGIQVLPAGDLDATLRQVSGYSRETLDPVRWPADAESRYEFVWASASEEGMLLGRGALIDDGSYHYVLTCLAPEAVASQLRQQWDRVFESFALGV